MPSSSSFLGSISAWVVSIIYNVNSHGKYFGWGGIKPTAWVGRLGRLMGRGKEKGALRGFFLEKEKDDGSLPPGDRDMARLPSLRLFMGLCSDSLISSGRGEERLLSEEDLALSLSSIISWSARLTASGTASLPDSLRGRPRFRFGPRKLGEGRLVWWREEVEVVRCLLRELSGERRPPAMLG